MRVPWFMPLASVAPPSPYDDLLLLLLLLLIILGLASSILGWKRFSRANSALLLSVLYPRRKKRARKREKVVGKVSEKALRQSGIKGKYEKNQCDNHTGNTDSHTRTHTATHINVILYVYMVHMYILQLLIN